MTKKFFKKMIKNIFDSTADTDMVSFDYILFMVEDSETEKERILKIFSDLPLEQMPLHINDNEIVYAHIAKWRLKKGV